jgi:hypothetical protein
MFKEFLIRKMLKSQLKGVPEAEQEKLIKLITENPQLFQQIATEVQEKVRAGMDQKQATMEVMNFHKDELTKLKTSL